jgi:carbon monoxide dehydrogenase subunit G
VAEFETQETVAAPPERIWAIVADLPRWPDWTPTVTELSYLSGDALVPGATARVHQPRLRPAVWTVTDVAEGRSFTWTTGAPGVRAEALHRVAPDGAGSRVTLRFALSGPLAPVVGLLYGRRIRRYVRTEAASLKRAAEAR